MSEKAKAAVEIFGKHVGTSDGYSEWIEVDQKRINLFADATLDHQFIHIDPERSAKLSPYKVTIAHGFLTLSLIPHLTSSIAPRDARAYDGLVMGVNYGLDKVRFPRAGAGQLEVARGANAARSRSQGTEHDPVEAADHDRDRRQQQTRVRRRVPDAIDLQLESLFRTPTSMGGERRMFGAPDTQAAIPGARPAPSLARTVRHTEHPPLACV